MSARKITCSSNGSVTFDLDSCFFQDLKTKIGWWRKKHAGLYYLNYSHISTTCQSVASPLQIHCRLGHPSLESLKKIIPSLSNYLPQNVSRVN